MCKFCNALDSSQAYNLQEKLTTFITRHNDPIYPVTVMPGDIQFLLELEILFDLLLREKYDHRETERAAINRASESVGLRRGRNRKDRVWG